MPLEREMLPDRSEAREKLLCAFRVHGTPQHVRFATQGDEHLVEVPCATRLASRCFHPASKALAKLVALASDRLVCHGHTALEEQFLDVAQAQLEAEVPAHGVTDDAGWKTVSVIDFGFIIAPSYVTDPTT
jgi:hypothetical protein